MAMSNSIPWVIGADVSSMHILVFAPEKLECKRVCLVSDLSLGLTVFFSLPFGVVQPSCCSSAITLQHWLLFLIFAVLPQHSSIWCFWRCGELSVLTNVPLLGSHKINNLEWIYGKIYTWAGWNFSTSILLNQGLKQQRAFDWCAYLK